jgi:hypothetical protein
MRKKMILRLGLVGVVATAGGASAFAVGCSGDDNGTGPAADSGADVTGFPDSSSDGQANHDSATDSGDAAPPPVHAKVLFVNAAADLPGVRICIGVGATPQLLPGVFALPNSVATGSPLPYPEIPPGTGGPLPDITDLQSLVLDVFLINASKIATNTMASTAELDCPTLLGSDGQGATMDSGIPLVKGTDYFQLPMAIPANTFLHGNVYLATLNGCGPGDTSAGATLRCGASYSATAGNLGLKIYQLDNGTPATATLNVQVLHASQAWDGLLGAQLQGQPLANTFGISDQTDGATPNAPIATLINYGAPVTPDAAAPQTIVAADYASLAAYVSVSAPDGGPLVLGVGTDGGVILGNVTEGVPFTDIQALSGYGTAADGGPADPLYVAGGNFTLVWVGDPTQSEYINPNTGNPAVDGGPSVFNTASPHFLMFPNNPAVPSE